MTTKPAMTTTVIIPCLNEERYLPLLLDDLAAQTQPADKVVVADCHSEDGTVRTAKAYKERLPLTIVQAPIRSASSARNAGAARADTDFLLFLDADMRIPPDFMERLAAYTERKHLDFVSPRFRFDGKHFYDKLLGAYLNCWLLLRPRILRMTTSIGGALYVRRSLHQAAGGYDDAMREFDDIDYSRRIQAQHAREGMAWNVVATTSSRRLETQGRFFSMVQSVPADQLLARHLIRPWMKRRGLKGKWEE